MSFNTSTGAYTAATGATTAAAGNVIRSATWNSIFTDIQTALTQLGQGTFAPPSSGIVLVNGANANVVIGSTARMRITGPTGAFSISGITGGADGKRIYLFNTVAFAMTLTNDATSTAENRILTLTGADVVLRAGTSFATLSYDGTLQRWILESSN
jgi:hypothetical protein